MILAAVLVLALLAFGYWAVWFTCGRRPLPDLHDPQTMEQPNWKPYKEHILAGMQWLEKQEIRPLQVISYDGKALYARFVPCENARGTILFFHGYRSACVVDFSAALELYHSMGLNLLLCDQRSHGMSQGKFLTFGAKERYDVLSWVTYLSLMLGEDHPLILDGMSMGATTVLLASELEFPGNVRGIIADCGFSCGADIAASVAKSKYGLPPKLTAAFLDVFTRLYAGFSLKQSSAVEAVRHTDLPVMIIHGLADRLVPPAMSDTIYAAIPGRKVLLQVPGAGHGGSYTTDTPRCQKALREYVDSLLLE